MNTRKSMLFFSIASLVGYVVGYYLVRVYDCGMSMFCYNLETKSFALYYAMPALAIVFFALFLFPGAVSAWKKFSIWYLPVAALFFVFYGPPASGDFFSPYPEQVFRWLSWIYVVISIAIISIYKVGAKNQR